MSAVGERELKNTVHCFPDIYRLQYNNNNNNNNDQKHNQLINR